MILIKLKWHKEQLLKSFANDPRGLLINCYNLFCYWLLAILEGGLGDQTEIKFRKLISRRVGKAWYPLSKYKLSFGLCDSLADPLV